MIALAASIALTLTGCDAVRASLGKPTSKDIEALRQQKARMERTADSVAIAMEEAPVVDTTLVAIARQTGPDVEEAIRTTAVTPSAQEAAAPQETAPKETAPAMETPVAEEVPAEPEYEETRKTLPDGFYAVIGSFKNAGNAEYLYNSISASGTPVEIVKMKNGFTAVMICRGDTYDEAYRGMREFYKDKKCPEGIWIYNTAKKLHIEQQ